MPEAGLTFQAPALCFDNEEDCFEAVTKRRYAEGCVGHGGSEAVVGGPIARVRDGDIIEIDAINDRIDLLVEDLELEKRKKDWQLRKTNFGSGALWKYAQSVGPAATVAVTHRGASSEATVYADV